METIPQSFGRYQILRPIATGGMAELFLARSCGVEGFEKRLVIKRILPSLATNQRFVDLFVQEAKVSACLSHPNIVQVFELGKVNDEHYIAMEYIHGRDLARVMRLLRSREERLPAHLAVAVTAAIARGLHYAHARVGPDGRPMPIIHRDVSPHNIILSFEGDVKLVDFGVAGIEGGPQPGGGKLGYMSPEQAAGSPADARSDVFSLGIVLFELLAGRRLYQEDDTDARRQQTLSAAIPDLRSLNLPPLLVPVLERALARAPDARFPDAASLEGELRSFLYAGGHYRTNIEIGALMRQLFADELGTEGPGLELLRLARDLEALHTGVESSVASMASSPQTSGSRPGFPVGRAERKSVVALVAEISGLTEVSAQAETEDLARIHYRMLRMMRRLIDRFGGVAERFDDDTLLVLFGLPRAHGDDVERALACAQDLHRMSARLRRRGLSVELSVGVHVGEVTVGRKQGKHFRFAPRGDTIKTCVRLAYAAEPGVTLVSDRVVGLMGDRFRFDAGPDLRRKGTRVVRRTFVLAGGRRPGAQVTLGAWMRRRDELEVLREAISGLREGRGAAIGVRGEAGIGKSRLLRDFRDLAVRRNLPVFSGRALPFGSERPFAVFRDLISDILGIRAEMDKAAILQRFERLSQLGLTPEEAAVIRALFAAELGERKEPGREAMFAALPRLVRGLSTDGPVIVLMEDIHYLNRLERELFDRLVQAAEDRPVLLLASWRGEAAPKLRDLALGALSSTQIVELAREHLGVMRVDPHLTALITRTTEGNPLYLEEILKALHRAGRIWLDGTEAGLRDPEVPPVLPDSLQGFIAERVDALEPPDKALLQLAAVLGMAFSPTLLAAAVGVDDSAPLMEGLFHSGLVVRQGYNPDANCTFVSSLVWECVRRSIPKQLGREYHRMVAAGLERLHGTEVEAVAETYAWHCEESGRYRDAAQALRQAGDRHRQGQFLERALSCYLRGVECLGKDNDSRLEALLMVSAGEVAQLLGQADANRYLQVAMDIASEDGPVEVEARAQLALGRIYLDRGKGTMARMYLDNACALMRRIGDRTGKVEALEALGALALEEGRSADAAKAFEEGLRTAGTDVALGGRMLLGLATHALRRDDLAGAEELLTRALPLAERAGDRILIGRIHNNRGIILFNRALYAEALTAFQKAMEVREGLGYRLGDVVNLHNIGDTYLRIHNPGLAYASFEQSRDLARECGWERGVVMNEVFLWYLRGLRGEDVTLKLKRAGERASQLGDREIALVARWLEGRLAGSVSSELATEAEKAGFADLARQIRATP